MEIKPLEKFEVKGRGTVFTFDLKENGLNFDSVFEVNAHLMGKQVTINGVLHDVIGVEATNLGFNMGKGCILVKIAL